MDLGSLAPEHVDRIGPALEGVISNEGVGRVKRAVTADRRWTPIQETVILFWSIVYLRAVDVLTLDQAVSLVLPVISANVALRAEDNDMAILNFELFADRVKDLRDTGVLSDPVAEFLLGHAANALDQLTPPQVQAVVVEPSRIAISRLGSTASFSARALDPFGTEIPGKVFTWTSLNPNVATVDASTGLTTVVTALRDGQVTIAADADGVSGYALLTVSVSNVVRVNLWSDLSPGFDIWDLEAIWGSSPDDIWATDGGVFLHFDGALWNIATPSLVHRTQAIWGTGTANIWAVGASNAPGSIWHYDGAQWAEDRSDLPGVNAVWGSAPDDVWAVGFPEGGGESIQHYDGTLWSDVSTGLTLGLFGIWGSGRTDVWAVGSAGAISHFDGSQWTDATPTPTRFFLSDVWGSDPDNVWAAGGGGSTGNETGFQHYDGMQWNEVAAGTVGVLRGVWGSGPDEVFAVGDQGLIMEFDGANWTTVTPPVTTTRLWNIWGTYRTDVWVVGESGTILRGVRGATIGVTPESPMAIAPGATVQLRAEARDHDGQAVSGVSFTWLSEDQSVATVDENGLVTGVRSGVVAITAVAPGGARGTAFVTVNTGG
jgi:hypothetical protein